MSKQNALQRATAAAATIVLLTLPMLSDAHGHERHHQARSAGMQAKKPRHYYFAHDKGYGPYAAAPSAPGQSGRCAWPYQNLYPPCMSTYPQGSPDYYGSPR